MGLAYNFAEARMLSFNVIVCVGPCVVKAVPLEVVELAVHSSLVKVAHNIIGIWDIRVLLLYY